MFKPTAVIICYCAYELGVLAFLKSDLIVGEVMYLSWDLMFATHVLYNGNLCNEI